MCNIKPAERLSAVQEYYFSRKLKEVAQLNAEGKDIISLAIGSPDMPPSKQTIAKLCEVASQPNAHGYQPTMGTPELRNAMAEFYHHWYNVDLDPKNEVLPLIGSKEGILHVTLAFCNPGDEVLVMDLSRVKLMWTNYPNMPTGGRAQMDTYRQLVAFSRKHNIVVVNDNPYSFILNNERLSLLQVPGAKETCIEFNSMSKSHNMPGWRVGMCLTNATFISWIMKVKSNIDSGTFRGIQLAAAEALNTNTEEWHNEANIITYRRRRDIAEEIMSTLHCTFDPSQLGMFLWGRIPDTYANVEDLTERVLHEARVFITPGFIFGSNGQRYIRISLCAKEDKMQEALSRIKQVFQD